MSLDEAALVADVRSRLFAPSTSALTIGAELEVIPVVAATKLPVRIDAARGPSLSQLVRDTGDSDWTEISGAGGAPSWNLPDGSRISFEPGGQIEISSSPQESLSDLVTSLQATVRRLATVAKAMGIELLFAGADPYNDISVVPLQLTSDRYVRMTRYFEARGEFGIRMMRQTAALQISIEHGQYPIERWTLLNALAPYFIAIFANSRRYAGRDTGHASYRSHFWRELDRSRTGIAFDRIAPPQAYADFALDAGALRADNGRGEFHKFRSLLRNPRLELEDWHFHLSTLFPEIRPKAYFEIRSADTISPENLIAPLAFVAGLVYDEAGARAATSLLGAPDASLLVIAGREGLRNPELKSRAAQLVTVSTDGMSRLPTKYLTPQHRAQATEWLTRRVS
jgi:glutamate--cysteine ligase